MQDLRIVVIGGSAGAIQPAIEICGALPDNLNAAVFVAIHITASARSTLPDLITRRSQLRAEAALDGEPIQAGRIYVAPPDHHLLVEPGRVRLGRGPRENGHRPAVDPLFRSAAASYRNRVTGVMLSGNLDDGAVGLREIRRAGGTSVIQDPADALYAGMPLTALDEAGADDVVTTSLLAATILRHVNRALPPLQLIPNYERDIAAGGEAPVRADERTQGELAPFGCPDCGGTLWETKEPGDVVHFRCRVGHAFSDESLLDAQNEGLERAMWTALRALEEMTQQAQRLTKRMEARGHRHIAARFHAQAVESEQRASIIRNALERVDVQGGETRDEV